jgi:ParB family chromosome partitioning protein
MTKKNALGRGLGALIDDASLTKPVETVYSYEAINEVDLSKIEVNPFQPRQDFNEEALDDLAASIKQLGVIQPITVRRIEGDKYQLITGERRFRASQQAGLERIPAYIRTADDQAMIEMSLVENVQREDLNAIEVAMGYQRLLDECHLTQENLSERVGKKRTTVTNYLRLLKLPAEVQVGLRENKLSMGHARALISLEKPDEQLKLYHRIINQDLSVRKVEELVRNINQSADTGNANHPNEEKFLQEYEALKNKLDSFFGTKIEFRRSEKGAGKIVISFQSDEELERIIASLDIKKE